MRRKVALTLALLVAGCAPWPPAGAGGLAERAALPSDVRQVPDAALAAATRARLVCLDQRYEALAAGGAADRRAALAAEARDARRNALRWTAAGLVQDGAIAADGYARLLDRLGGPWPAGGAAAC